MENSLRSNQAGETTDDSGCKSLEELIAAVGEKRTGTKRTADQAGLDETADGRIQTTNRTGLARVTGRNTRKPGLKRANHGPRNVNERWGRQVKKFLHQGFGAVEERLSLPEGRDWVLPEHVRQALAATWNDDPQKKKTSCLPEDTPDRFKQMLAVAALTYERNVKHEKQQRGNVQNMSATVAQTAFGKDVNAAARFYQCLVRYSSENGLGWFPAMGKTSRSSMLSTEAHRWYGQLGTRAERQALLADVEAIEVAEVRKYEQESEQEREGQALPAEADAATPSSTQTRSVDPSGDSLPATISVHMVREQVFPPDLACHRQHHRPQATQGSSDNPTAATLPSPRRQPTPTPIPMLLAASMRPGRALLMEEIARPSWGSYDIRPPHATTPSSNLPRSPPPPPSEASSGRRQREIEAAQGLSAMHNRVDHSGSPPAMDGVARIKHVMSLAMITG